MRSLRTSIPHIRYRLSCILDVDLAPQVREMSGRKRLLSSSGVGMVWMNRRGGNILFYYTVYGESYSLLL